jgi:hypothetical protein
MASKNIEEFLVRLSLFPSPTRNELGEEMKQFMATLYAMLDINVHQDVITIDRTSKHFIVRYDYIHSLSALQSSTPVPSRCSESWQLRNSSKNCKHTVLNYSK